MSQKLILLILLHTMKKRKFKAVFFKAITHEDNIINFFKY